MKRAPVVALVCLVGAGAWPVAAGADELPLQLIDRVGGGKGMALDVGFAFRELATYWRTELQGRLASTGSHHLVASIPVVGSKYEQGLGSLQLGWLRQFDAAEGVAAYTHLGLGLPTADRDLVGTHINSGLIRPGELAMSAPETAWLRFAMSATYDHSCWLGQLTGGLDFPLASSYQPNPMGRIAAAFGRRHGPFSLAGEAVAVFGTEQLTIGADKGVLGLGATAGYGFASCYLLVHAGGPLGQDGDVLVVSGGVRCGER